MMRILEFGLYIVAAVVGLGVGAGVVAVFGRLVVALYRILDGWLFDHNL